MPLGNILLNTPAPYYTTISFSFIVTKRVPVALSVAVLE